MNFESIALTKIMMVKSFAVKHRIYDNLRGGNIYFSKLRPEDCTKL